MTSNDLDRLAGNEKILMDGQKINRICDIPNFPFSSLEELRAAKKSGAITFGAPYRPDLLEAFGTRGEILANYFWTNTPVLIGITFIVAAFVTGKYTYFWGVLTTLFGFLLAAPYLRRLASPFIGLGWMFCIYFALTRPVWAWVIGGFYGGIIFAGTARLQLTMLLEKKALTSEILFCYLFLNRILVVKDNKRNEFL
ncbi:MAG: hypothetical protein PHY43_08690 [Verrucomicrobiales bacterium]|nr:hypothetical protein [Verrucomicrobiales bacterium]